MVQQRLVLNVQKSILDNSGFSHTNAVTKFQGTSNADY